MVMSGQDVVILLDGGIGHEIKLRGISDGTFVAGMLSNKDTDGEGARSVESVHYDFLSSGCDVITTNSFVAVPRRMLECGLASDEDSSHTRAVELIIASVDRARAAITKYNTSNYLDGNRGGPKRIAGCIPPLTDCYIADKVPLSNDLIPGYTKIVSTLIACGVEILLAETLSTLREGLAIVQTLSLLQKTEAYEEIPALWMSFTVDDERPSQLRSGEPLQNVCQSIIEESMSLDVIVEAIGVNCSTPGAISMALHTLKTVVDGTDIKCMCYGNCFQTTTSEWIRSLGHQPPDESLNSTSDMAKHCRPEDYDADGRLLPMAYALYADSWAKAGATIIGGCCGCGPDHMKAVALMLNKKLSTK